MKVRSTRYFIIIFIDGEYDCTLLFNALSIEDVKKQFKKTFFYQIVSYEVSGFAKILNENYEEVETIYFE